jgi:gliding motility-associated-like protein
MKFCSSDKSLFFVFSLPKTYQMKKLLLWILFLVEMSKVQALPTDTLLQPARNATLVPANTRLQLFFNEPMQKGVGSVFIYDGSTNNLIFSIPIGCSCIVVQENKVMVTLPSMLSANQVVYVKILSGVLLNLSNQPFGGFNNPNDWRFTIASGLILHQSFLPSNNSSCVSINQNTFQFYVSGNVTPNTTAQKYIYIYEKISNRLHDRIAVSSSRVVANNSNVITFTTNQAFLPSTEYYILIDPVSFVGAGGFVYEGIYDSTTWTFRTSEGKAIANRVETCGVGEVLLKASYTRNDVQYRWYNTALGGEPLRNPSGQIVTTDTIRVNVSQSTTYYVAVFSNNCLSYERTPVQVVVLPLPESTLPPAEIRIGRGVFLQLEANGGVSYTWQPTEGLSDPNIANPNLTAQENTTYTVTIKGQNGCSIQKSVSIIIDDGEKDCFIPTMFSPNEDGTHDFLRVKGKNIAEIDWSIYDSFGKLLYRTTSVSEASTKGWDGTFQGRPLQSDVYVWTLKGRFSDGSPLPQKAGSVLLIR